MTREERTAKLQRDRAAARDAGRRVGGNSPYGWKSVRGQLVPVPNEQGPRWLILHLAAKGWPLQRIADALLGLGIPPRSGKTWSRSAVRLVIMRAAGEAPATRPASEQLAMSG